MPKEKQPEKKISEDDRQPFVFLLSKKGYEENTLWFSVSESAKLAGVGDKTIRRAIKTDAVKFKIVNDRYQIDLKSLILYMHTSTKLKNKFYQLGLGQYVKKFED